MTIDREMLTIESTKIDATAVMQDRGAMETRSPIAGSEKLKKLAVPGVIGVGFIVMVMASVSGKPEEGLKLQDKEAAQTADQAAKAVVSDPLGNRPLPAPITPIDSFDANGQPIAMGEQPLQPGQQVPAISSEDEPRANAAAQRRERREREREQELREEEARRDAIRRSPVMALSSSRGRSGGNTTNGNFGDGNVSVSLPQQQTALESRLQTSTLGVVRASTLTNRNFLITAGSQIPCVLQTAMDSSLPGFTSCLLPRSVFSDNGRVVLLEKGTRVLGEYQGGLQQGQNRLFVVWNRAITPKGVVIHLSSPAADALGRSGMGGKVETFFWKRFGGAMLLSMIGDLGAAASDRLTNARETSRAPNQAAAVALENDIRIPPRLRAAQGSEMTIFVAKDVDFSSVYSLRLRR
jgi:type IV secretion system protein VirB10